MKEQGKTPERNLNGTGILPDKEFKVMVISVLTELGGRMDEHIENFIKEVENIRKYQIVLAEMKIKTKTEQKNTQEGISSTLEGTEDWISELNHTERQLPKQNNKKKKNF